MVTFSSNETVLLNVMCGLFIAFVTPHKHIYLTILQATCPVDIIQLLDKEGEGKNTE